MNHTASPRRTLAALTGAVLSLGLLVGCGDDTDPDNASGTPSETTASEDPTGSATTAPSTGSTDSARFVIPTYYVGKTPLGDRLFREFTSTSGSDKLVVAAAALTNGAAIDPDYTSLWPRGRFEAVTQTATAIVVEVPEQSWLERGSLSAADADLAVQQLVWTLQGAAAKRLPITVEYDGKPATTLLGVPVGAGLKAKKQLDVLALMNVTEPAEGTTVDDKFTANGRASSFEATVLWNIEDSSGKVVLEGFATAEGWTDKLYPWTTQVDVSSLDPGTYTFIARTDDPSDGEGSGPTTDSKKITVE